MPIINRRHPVNAGDFHRDLRGARVRLADPGSALQREWFAQATKDAEHFDINGMFRVTFDGFFKDASGGRQRMLGIVNAADEIAAGSAARFVVVALP